MRKPEKKAPKSLSLSSYHPLRRAQSPFLSLSLSPLTKMMVPGYSMRTSRMWRRGRCRLAATGTDRLLVRQRLRALEWSMDLSVGRGLRVPSADPGAGPDSPREIVVS